MCVARPMQVIAIDAGFARCSDHRGAEAQLDLSLVGDAKPGQWLLAFHGVAREILDESRALEIARAVDAVEAAMRGEAPDVVAAFPDLVNREPQLPEFLR
jgi:hydrogenase expression/formation protein HypC